MGLDKRDADFVEAIHTFSGYLIQGKLGTTHNVGHIDYFVNGGTSQPGCESDPEGIFDVLRSVCKYSTCRS